MDSPGHGRADFNCVHVFQSQAVYYVTCSDLPTVSFLKVWSHLEQEVVLHTWVSMWSEYGIV